MVGAALLGGVAVLHLPVAAPFLRRLGSASMCPVTGGTPEQIDRAHAIASTAIRQTAASTPAPSRPALGFTLEVTTHAELDAWAARHRLSCTSIGHNENLRSCANVPPSAVGQPEGFGPLEEVSFELRSTGEIVDIQTLRRHLPPELAATIASNLEEQTSTRLGPPTTTGGEPTAQHLARGPLATYVATHTFSDYRATISATKLAATGVMVREQYLALAP